MKRLSWCVFVCVCEGEKDWEIEGERQDNPNNIAHIITWFLKNKKKN